MVIIFEEKDRAAIEATGMTVIEFKRRLYRMGKATGEAFQVLKEISDKIANAFIALSDAIYEAFDNVKLIIGTVRDKYHLPTSRRYKIVKVFSKCTGIDIRTCWKITYGIKRLLNRVYHCRNNC